ncbi:MAG TPA: hypothetical protein VFE33_36330 [Thermoanaerobaculia bacterium]|nr:hypothetical protein [Thermoanaerobaculia bacterium]
MKKSLSLALLFAAALMLSSGGNTLNAATGWERHFTVYYSCIVSPPMSGHVEGEWDVDCDLNWTGWGSMPGTGCTTSDVTYGNYCGTEGPSLSSSTRGYPSTPTSTRLGSAPTCQ